jgi:hypothetical protein
MKKLIFYSCLLLISISASAQVPSYVPTNGLVGYWPFNGNANDESGNGNNGTVNGATLTNDRNNSTNKSYNFDGINDWIEVANWNKILGNNSFTLSYWIYQESNLGWTVSFGVSNDGEGFTSGSYHWGTNSIGGQIWKYNFSSTTNTTIELNKWTNVIFKYDSNILSIYKNGVFVSSQLVNYTSTNISAGSFNIGKQLSFSEYYKGKIDDIGIWNRALTQSEITSLYTQNYVSQIPSYIPSNGLVAYYPFNGNANDASVNGNNGTVNGATLDVDRFGNLNSTYDFNGINNFIDLGNSQSLNSLQLNYTISYWIHKSDSIKNGMVIASFAPGFNGAGWRYHSGVRGDSIESRFMRSDNITWAINSAFQDSVNLNKWLNICNVRNGVNFSTYVNGVLSSNSIVPNTTINNAPQNTLATTKIGANWPSSNEYFGGKIDDIGIWNRALNQQEITSLYNGNICFETVRVTDTLVINVNRTGYNPITYSNTIKVYPNPANNKITIDNGDIQKMNGYSIKIINSLGQQVYQGGITQQIVSIDITQWAGNGMYYLQLTDNNGNIVDVKKIVLQ